MGAVRMRVQTADKNITSNLHHSSPSINVLNNVLNDVFIGEQVM